jgi:hypothetical protein
MRSYKEPSAIPTIAHDYLQMTQIARQNTNNSMPSSTGPSCYASNTNDSNTEETPTTSTKKCPFKETNADFEDFQGVVLGDEESSVDLFAEAAAAAEAMKQEDSDESENALGCDNTMRKSFQEYVLKQVCALQFTTTEVSAIQLLAKLRQTKAPMNTYDSVMHWHLSTVGKIHETQSVRDSSDFISRDKIFNRLRERYKYTESYHQVAKITLPHSKAKAQIVWNDAREVITSLLTDPRITDDDYLFFEDNPLAPPPERLNFIEDVNTGRAYVKTYKKYITRPGEQVLLPVIFYIDAATTGQFADLPVTAVKITLGIFSRKAREKNHCWRILGYIPAVLKHKSKGRRILLDSLHVDGIMAHQDALEDEGLADNADISKAQDFHSMLEVVLKSYIDLQNTGFFGIYHLKAAFTKTSNLFFLHLLLRLMVKKRTSYVVNTCHVQAMWPNYAVTVSVQQTNRMTHLPTTVLKQNTE